MGAAAPTAGTWEGLGRVGPGGGAAWVAEVGGRRVGMRLEGIWLPPPGFWGQAHYLPNSPQLGRGGWGATGVARRQRNWLKIPLRWLI